MRAALPTISAGRHHCRPASTRSAIGAGAGAKPRPEPFRRRLQSCRWTVGLLRRTVLRQRRAVDGRQYRTHRFGGVTSSATGPTGGSGELRIRRSNVERIHARFKPIRARCPQIEAAVRHVAGFATSHRRRPPPGPHLPGSLGPHSRVISSHRTAAAGHRRSLRPRHGPPRLAGAARSRRSPGFALFTPPGRSGCIGLLREAGQCPPPQYQCDSGCGDCDPADGQ